MRGADLLLKLLGMLARKTAVAQVGEYLHGKGIPACFQRAEVFRQLFVHAPLDAVPEVHVRLGKQRVIRLLADQVMVLIPPAFPRRPAVEDALGLLERSARNFGKESLPPRAGMAHDRVEKSREEKAVDVLAPFALDVGVISKSHSVGDRGRDRQALVCQHLHQHAAAVGNAVENVDLPAVMLDHIVA